MSRALLFSSLFLVSLLALWQPANAMKGLVGACKTHNYTSFDIEVTSYAGLWYEIAHSESFSFDKDAFCTTATYTPNTDGTINVLNQSRYKSVSGKVSSTKATARAMNPNKPGSLIVTFNPFAKAPYDVLMVGPKSADGLYEWAVVVTCDGNIFFGGSYVWVLSRQPTMDTELYNQITSKVRDMGFVLDDLVLTKQQGCWATDFEAPAPILKESGLVGACKTKNYTTVNIDVNRYMGKWYDVSHMSDFFFSKGAVCITAEYSLNSDKTIKVHNCQRIKDVTAKTECSTGRARAPDASKPGSLLVSFSIFAEGPYDVVMVGDNYEFAVVVSCSHSWFFPQSLVWILSRTPTLPAETLSAIKAKVVDMGFVIDHLVDTQQQGCW